MVRRRDADLLVAAVALPLSAGGVPVRATARGECQARPGRSRVRAGRHGRVRRRPLLADHRGLRQGGTERPVPAHPRAQRRTRSRAAACAADAVVSQPLVVGGGHRASPDQRGRDAVSRIATAIAEEERLGRWRLAAGPDPAGRLPELLFCENETNMSRLFGVPGNDAVSQGRHQRPCRRRRGDGQSGAARNEDGVLVPPDGRPRRHRRAATAAGARRRRRHARPGRRLRAHARRARARSRRVLRGRCGPSTRATTRPP